MVKVNILGDAFKKIVNAERKGDKQVIFPNFFKLNFYPLGFTTPILQGLDFLPESYAKAWYYFYQIIILQKGYIGEFEIVDDHRACKIVVELVGRINKVGVISPRYDIKMKDYENWC